MGHGSKFNCTSSMSSASNPSSKCNADVESVVITVSALFFLQTFLCIFCSFLFNWASEASPTLGCSIEISRDI